MMENKTIHYCWFGKGKKSRRILKCIKSWKKFFPDWSIKEWNEENFDIHINKYVEQAYDNKKWAFVSDYARLWILYNYGGIYFDTDVLVVKSFSDIKHPILSIERGIDYDIAPGLVMSCEKTNQVCLYIMKQYESDKFILDNGFNKKTICDRFTELFSKNGFVKEDKMQEILGFNIYPTEFFCPYDNYRKIKNTTSNTHSIHLYLGSWLSGRERLSYFLNYLKRKIFK